MARIVQHVLPGGSTLHLVDANVDKSTANWLNQSYNVSNTKMIARESLGGHDSNAVSEEEEKLRMQRLQQNTTIAVSRESLESWDFNVLSYTNVELCEIMTYMFCMLKLLDKFQTPLPVFRKFVSEMSNRYLENSYHNFKHACDVCHTCFQLIRIPHLHLIFTPLEVFSILVGAIAHDVGHPGINNVYLIKARHELALQHNDRSPLENMHCAVLYEMLGGHGSRTANSGGDESQSLNIFRNLTEQQWRESRRVILAIILGTDMSHHFEQISKTQVGFVTCTLKI